MPDANMRGHAGVVARQSGNSTHNTHLRALLGFVTASGVA